jgi:HTH-type transcriptional regulator / antitoxin HigA
MTIETESENEAVIMLAESLEHRQRTPEEDALIYLTVRLKEIFKEKEIDVLLPN